MADFLDQGVREGRNLDLYQEPEYASFEDVQAGRQSLMDFYADMQGILQNNRGIRRTAGHGWDTNYMRQLALSRQLQIQQPTPSKPALGELTPGAELLAKEHENRRLNSALSAINEVEVRRAMLRNMMETNPEIAAEVDISEDWFNRLQGASLKAARKGWRALDFVLRNLDRGRGAFAEYQLTLNQGGTQQEASRRAKAALLGSEKGWRWMPEKQAPSFKEVLKAAGMEDDLSTALVGFGMDVLVDPINVLGIGASRKGLEIGAHQILNQFGRDVYGRVVRKNLDGLASVRGLESVFDLGPEALQMAHKNAAAEMRQLIREGGISRAEQYLDLGGLKIAGYTLPGTAFIRKREAIRGGLEYDYVSDNLLRMFGKGTLTKLDEIGGKLASEGQTSIAKRVGKFMEAIPASLREAGNALGLLFNRTNPAAGKEYRWFKQAEYYDRLGYEELQIKDSIRQIFDGLHSDDLTELPFAIESGREAVEKYIQNAAVRKGAAYGARLAEAEMMYRKVMDEIVIDEAKRGWFAREWQHKPHILRQFEAWVRSDGQLRIPDADLLAKFEKTRVENYVPHIYHNAAKARKLAPPSRKAEVPSIVEPFTKRRITNSLQEAIDRGLVPEMNLAVIATQRMVSHTNATVTHDFLEKAMETFGANRAGIIGMDRQIIRLAGEPRPAPFWEDLMRMRVNVHGKVAMDLGQQMEYARKMAMTSNVPTKAVAKLDDTAIQEFLRHRLRLVTVGKGRGVWRKYVETATAKGHYDGFALAPARTEADAVAKARDLVDPAYPSWTFVKAGGLADPEKLKKMLFPVPIVEDLERMRVKQSEEFKRVIKLYDVLNYWWKRNVTVIWPAFHARNKLTNIVNSAADIGIAGVLDRGTMQGIIRGADGRLVTPSGHLSYSQVRKLARRYGVVRAAYRRADVSEMIQDVVRTDTKAARRLSRQLGVKLPGREELLKKGEIVGPTHVSMPISIGTLQQAGGEVGMIVENADRMQLFVKSLQRGMSPEQAARRVNQFLFDYDDISRAEAQVIRRFFNPFWTWTRKNIALQAKVATKSPGRFTPPAKFARALSSEEDDAMRSDVERELLPRYLSDTFAVRLDTAGEISRWMMNIDMPHEDLNRLWQGNLQKTGAEWISSVGPFAREILETAVGYDFYKGQKRVEFVRGTRVYNFMEKFENTPLKDFLRMRTETYRDQKTIYVDAKQWRKLMWLTAWQMTRFYTTVGRVTDPANGTVTQRLFNFLTGAREENIRPGEELRRMADAAIFDRDVGQLHNLRNKWNEAIDALKARGANERAAEQQLLMTELAIETPVYGGELPPEDTEEYAQAEE